MTYAPPSPPASCLSAVSRFLFSSSPPAPAANAKPEKAPLTSYPSSTMDIKQRPLTKDSKVRRPLL